jgi:hypothetical protein
VLTELDVIELYRCLLGRDPEDAATIKAFRAYYKTRERGRKALLDSNEFQTLYAGITGRSPHAQENTAAVLAHAFLARAGAAVPPPPPAPADPALRASLRILFGNQPQAALAVIVGDSDSVNLEDLVPLERPDAAVLHVAANFPPVVPLTSTLANGITLFRMSAGPDSLAAFLQSQKRQIDALYLLGRPAGPDWFSALYGLFAKRTLVALGPQTGTFPASQISAAIEAAYPSEPVQDLFGLRLHHFGGSLLPVSYAPPAAPPPLPDRAAYPRLALAAIMRNEAICVENMLRSVLPVASFIALLDTGSTDRTVDIARSVLSAAGAPFAIEQAARETFDNDFSAMRNTAIGMVPAEIPWILMLDADEELAPEDYEPLLNLLAAGTHDAFALPRYNFPGADKQGLVLAYPDRQVRLFRNTPDRRIRYSGAVHEKILGIQSFRVPHDTSSVGGPRGGPHIHHLVRRFRTQAEEKQKQELYKRIEQKQQQ